MMPHMTPAAFVARIPARPRVIVLGSGERPNVPAEAARLRPEIEKYAEIVVWDLAFTRDLSTVEADLAIVLGGDGSLLRAAHALGERQLPVLGVNLGKLGFLADLAPEELLALLPHLGEVELAVVEHLMFDCGLIRDGRRRAGMLGLNEVVVHGGPPFRLIDVDLYVDAELATTYSCDGLIVSTPVGSTAHSLSAGGPILGQELDAFVITPISPHTLTNRPVVDAASKTYTIDIRRASGDAALVVDGQESVAVRVGQQITIRKAPVEFALVKVPGHSYYQTLRAKLNWGTTPNYREP